MTDRKIFYRIESNVYLGGSSEERPIRRSFIELKGSASATNNIITNATEDLL